MRWRRRPTRRAQQARTMTACVLLVVVYYLVPVQPDLSGAAAAVRAGGTVAAALAVAMLVGRLVVRVQRGESGGAAAGLVVALVGGVVLFAFIDYLVAVTMPGQFADLRTKTDALYFTVTTLATVGFGDVHAAGQLARAVVTGQQVYNLVVIATGGTALVNHITRRRAGTPPQTPA